MIDLKQCSLGIELGSTRIKAVLVGDTCKPVARAILPGEPAGKWHLDLPAGGSLAGVQAAYAALAADVRWPKCGQPLTSGVHWRFRLVMHGYLAFDAAGKLLVPFTWRNTMTGAAAEELTSAFGFNIRTRWAQHTCTESHAELREPHLPQLDFFTTLAGYVTGTERRCWAKAMPAACSRLTAPPAGMMPQCSQKFNALADKAGCPWILSNCCLPFCP